MVSKSCQTDDADKVSDKTRNWLPSSAATMQSPLRTTILSILAGGWGGVEGEEGDGGEVGEEAAERACGKASDKGEEVVA